MQDILYYHIKNNVIKTLKMFSNENIEKVDVNIYYKNTECSEIK